MSQSGEIVLNTVSLLGHYAPYKTHTPRYMRIIAQTLPREKECNLTIKLMKPCDDLQLVITS